MKIQETSKFASATPSGYYKIKLRYYKETDKAVFVMKKRKTGNSHLWIPKSIILNYEIINKEVRLWKDASYTAPFIYVVLPKWYCDKKLKCYA